MDFQKLKLLNRKISEKKDKYYQEKNNDKKKRFGLELQILELRIKLERLNKN